MFRLFKQGNTAKLIVSITTSQFSTGAKFTASAITATFYKLNGTNDDLELDTGIGVAGVVTLTADKLGKTGWHTALVDFSAVTAKEYLVVFEATVDGVDAINQQILDVSAELARLAVCALEATSQEILAAILPDGNNAVTIHVQDGLAAPIPDVFVRIADATGTITIATGVTDSGGDYIVALDDGTYQVLLRKAFVNFTVPETLVVLGATTDTYTGDVITPSAPTQPDTCVVYGVVIDVKGDPVEGAKIYIQETDNETFSNTQKIVRNKETTSDATGYWEIETIRSSALDPATSSYRAIIEYRSFKYETAITVPDLNSAEFSTLKGT